MDLLALWPKRHFAGPRLFQYADGDATVFTGAGKYPGEQRQLAAQLGMRGWPFFRFVEWPWLRRQIPRLPH